MDEKGVFGGNNVFDTFAQQPTAGTEKVEAPTATTEQAAQPESAEDLNEEGLNAENIKMVM